MQRNAIISFTENRKKLFTEKLRLSDKGETFKRDNKGKLRMLLKFGQVMEGILV